ncbi:PAS domain S-box protein [Babesia caballi]|uniref:PAS domain S-box protein n=1 Tax=Babesia caballi TaxID=5871 RepID=A0AAV4M378_BABCB|nr:PAS domain S-box protein [Babesia caballi]
MQTSSSLSSVFHRNLGGAGRDSVDEASLSLLPQGEDSIFSWRGYSSRQVCETWGKANLRTRFRHHRQFPAASAAAAALRSQVQKATGELRPNRQGARDLLGAALAEAGGGGGGGAAAGRREAAPKVLELTRYALVRTVEVAVDLPKPHLAAVAATQNEQVVWMNVHAHHAAGVPAQAGDQRAVEGVPELYDALVAAGDEHVAGVVEPDAAHLGGLVVGLVRVDFVQTAVVSPDVRCPLEPPGGAAELLGDEARVHAGAAHATGDQLVVDVVMGSIFETTTFNGFHGALVLSDLGDCAVQDVERVIARALTLHHPGKVVEDAAERVRHPVRAL